MWNVQTFKSLVYAAEDAIRADIGSLPFIIETQSYDDFIYDLERGEDQITLASARRDFFIFERILFNPFSLSLSIVRDSDIDDVLKRACERQNLSSILQVTD